MHNQPWEDGVPRITRKQHNIPWALEMANLEKSENTWDLRICLILLNFSLSSVIFGISLYASKWLHSWFTAWYTSSITVRNRESIYKEHDLIMMHVHIAVHFWGAQFRRVWTTHIKCYLSQEMDNNFWRVLAFPFLQDFSLTKNHRNIMQKASIGQSNRNSCFSKISQ